MRKILTPNEMLTGTPDQYDEILARLTRWRTDPRTTLKLTERYPHLTFTTLDEVAEGLTGADRDVFAAGLELAGEPRLPMERVFVADVSGGFHYRLLPERQDDDTQTPGYRYVQAADVIAAYGPAAPGMAGLDLLRNYVHDTFHYLTFRSYRLGRDGVHRNQHGINFRRASGQTYSSREPATRNLGVVMEGAFDREATALVRQAVEAAGITCPVGGVDRDAFLDATGAAMGSYGRVVTEPYAAFLEEIGGPEGDDLHDLVIVATLSGDLGPLTRWLDGRYGPGEFTALFRSEAYAAT